MSSEPSSLPEQDSGGTHFYFPHPAGLRVARHIVASLIRGSGNGISQNENDNFSSTSAPTFASSPEVASLLKEIWAFSEVADSVQPPVDTGNATSSPNVNRGNVADARPSTTWGTNYSSEIRSGPFSAVSSQSSTGSFHPQHSFTTVPLTAPQAIANSPASFYASNMRTTSTSSQQTQPSEHIMSGSAGSAASRATDSPFCGTESPYNVESPSGRSSTFTPQPMSRQSSGRHATMPNLPNPESEPLRLDEATSYNLYPQASQGSNNTQTKLACGGYSTQLQTILPSNRSQPCGNPSSNLQSRTPQTMAPHIKNFLPVNKTPNNNSKLDPRSKERAIAISNKPAQILAPMSTLASTSFHQSPVAIVPHPGIDNPLFKAQMATTEPLPTKKRKPKAEGTPRVKRQKTDKATIKPKRAPKEKAKKPDPIPLDDNTLMIILEHCPPKFLKKARLVDRHWKYLVDDFVSIRRNQRKNNYDIDLPTADVLGLTELQYTDLLGGKGCLEPGCTDTAACRTHWSWAKRWCGKCWSSKIEREDRTLKARQQIFPNRLTLQKLLECIPVGMYDSFQKAHDYIENVDARPATAPRIYKYYIKTEVDKIIEEYEAFKILPFKDDPTKSAAENASARTDHAQRESEAQEKQKEFLDTRKLKNDEHMQRVLKIEGAIRKKREQDKIPNDKNRKARIDFFLGRAGEEIPDIPTAFVLQTASYKAATRIYRTPGSERCWQTLKPKIQKAWDRSDEKRRLESGESQIAEQDHEIQSNRIEQSQDDQFSNNMSSMVTGHTQHTLQNQLMALQAQNERRNHLSAFHAQNDRHNQPSVDSHQYNQTNIQNFMANRAHSMIPSSGMFGTLSSNNNSNGYGVPTNNIYGRTTVPNSHSDVFPSNSLGNNFGGGAAQFHLQSSDMNHGLPHMPMGFSQQYQSDGYMQFPQASNNNHNNGSFGSGSVSNPPGGRKITVNSLLTNPAPDVSMGYDAFQ
ncbi:hypothetical protein VTL71DRAFT_15091 [Oculimacula yallundae]|uniref:F-box domain-containing protein n=1 Tax=Oculimacula yallundae TaxID=86028 RepID=A0ABR4CHT5_9HELO